MKKSSTSIKISLALAGAFAVGLAASGHLGHLAQSLTPAAEASPGNGCTVKMLKGNYGYWYDVNIYGLGDFNGIGSQTCDNQGSCAGTDTLMVFGGTTVLPFTSVYSVNADCTGDGEITYSNGIVVHTVFTMVDGGKEIHFVGADAEGQSAGVSKRR